MCPHHRRSAARSAPVRHAFAGYSDPPRSPRAEHDHQRQPRPRSPCACRHRSTHIAAKWGSSDCVYALAEWRAAMSSVLVRDLYPAVVERLKLRAEENRRSLQKELKAILETAVAQATWAEARASAERVRQ